MDQARRRLLISTAVALAAVPAVTRAADPKSVKRLGIIVPGAREEVHRPPREIKALEALGWKEGSTLVIEWRYTGNDPDSGAAIAADLVRNGVDAIWTIGTPTSRALQRAALKVPIVIYVADPVGNGFAQSLARPGGNITGLAWSVPESAAKLVGFSRRLAPRVTRLSMLRLKQNRDSFEMSAPLAKAAREAGVAAEVRLVEDLPGVEGEMKRLAGEVTGAAYVANDIGTLLDPKEVARAAIRHRVALFTDEPYIARAGALMSYVMYHDDPNSRGAALIDKVLRGRDPAEIPFEFPQATHLAVNRRTAAALKLEIAGDVLLRADEVID